MFRLFQRERVQAYCQTCGTDLTSSGGLVATNNRIYCKGYKGEFMKCIERSLLENPVLFLDGMVMAGYKNAGQVQKDIRRRILTHYRRLEEMLP